MNRETKVGDIKEQVAEFLEMWIVQGQEHRGVDVNVPGALPI